MGLVQYGMNRWWHKSPLKITINGYGIWIIGRVINGPYLSDRQRDT